MTVFLIAVQFLSIVPVRLKAKPTDTQLGRSLLFYPLVGALLGVTLALSAALCASLPPPVTATVLLTLLCIASGGLHLDGLADSCDALAGGGDRERALAIMRDSRIGALGAVAVGVNLIAKFAAFTVIIAADTVTVAAITVVAAITIARTAVIALYATTDYVRTAGIGAPIAANLPRAAGTVTVIASVTVATVATAVSVDITVAIAMFTAAVIAFTVCRRLMVARIGGATGDTTGATVEMVESAALLAAAATL